MTRPLREVQEEYNMIYSEVRKTCYGISTRGHNHCQLAKFYHFSWTGNDGQRSNWMWGRVLPFADDSFVIVAILNKRFWSFHFFIMTFVFMNTFHVTWLLS